MRSFAPVCFVSLLAAGCGSATPGAQPDDMSVSAHEKMARADDAAASAHAVSYDPKAGHSETHCRAPSDPTGGYVPCWTSTTNPTSPHADAAGEFRSMAADHRAAAEALRDAERTSCAKVDNDDRDISPFSHADDIVSVSQLGGSHVEGSAIVLRAVPGLTEEYLERTVQCHLARNAAMGFQMKETAFCPLGVKGAKATVTKVSQGFRVSVTADDEATAKAIAARAAALTPGH